MGEILDCTFRDGGYYTSWEFPDDLVESYLVAFSQSGVSHVEVGYVGDAPGKFRNVSKQLLETFRERLPGKILYLMSDYPVVKRDVKSFYKDLGCDCVRIAVCFDEIDDSQIVFSSLKDLGFETSINITKFNLLPEFQRVIEQIDKWDVDVIYLADSLGSAQPTQVREAVLQCKQLTGKKIGFHGHDNQGLAVFNSLAALDAGASIVDGTIAGMGKGAGNAATEELIFSLSEDTSLFSLSAMFQLLKEKHKWGKNLYYFLSSKYNINPSFVQEMLDLNVRPEEIIKALPKLVGSYRR